MSASHLVITILLSLISIVQSVNGQLKITAVNHFPEIHGKIKNYILSYSRKSEFFSSLSASDIENQQRKKQKVQFHSQSYRYRLSLDSLWDLFLKTNPAKIWNSPIVQLITVYDPYSDTLIFPTSNREFFVQEHQIFFVNLRYIVGLINLPTALKITRIDPENHLLEFSYLDGGKAEGRQQLRFFKDNQGGTIIEHQTLYFSHSTFRDKRLYPYFHTLAINELHYNLKILSDDKSH